MLDIVTITYFTTEYHVFIFFPPVAAANQYVVLSIQKSIMTIYERKLCKYLYHQLAISISYDTKPNLSHLVKY